MWLRFAQKGFEYVDCELDDGSWMLVQSKERGPGSLAIAVAELADIIAHAVPALLALASLRSIERAESEQQPAIVDGNLPALEAVRVRGRYRRRVR